MPLGATLAQTFASFASTRHRNEVIAPHRPSSQIPRHFHSNSAPGFVTFYSILFLEPFRYMHIQKYQDQNCSARINHTKSQIGGILKPDSRRERGLLPGAFPKTMDDTTTLKFYQ
jgi:hypothetical protein